MDEIFSIFVKTLDEPIFKQEAPTSSIDYYEKKLPRQLLAYWAEQGWCGYGHGIFWTVDPHEYEGVVASWIDGTPLAEHDTYHVIARGAFGDLYLYGEKTGFSLSIASHLSHYCGNNRRFSNIDRHVQSFFYRQKRRATTSKAYLKQPKRNLAHSTTMKCMDSSPRSPLVGT